MLHYDIDIAENEYEKLEGDAASPAALRNILTENGSIPDLTGYLSSDDLPGFSVCICMQKELGVFIAITNENEETVLSLGDETALSETVDVWGDELYISKGLFIPDAAAWDALEAFFFSGSRPDSIRWLPAEEIPEDGNYIC